MNIIQDYLNNNTLNLNNLIKNQKVKINMATTDTSYIKITSLQSNSTPGIYSNFKLKNNTQYLCLAEGYNKNKQSEVFLYLTDNSWKNLIKTKIQLNFSNNIYLYNFYNKKHNEINFGLLFKNPKINSKFYIKHLIIISFDDIFKNSKPSLALPDGLLNYTSQYVITEKMPCKLDTNKIKATKATEIIKAINVVEKTEPNIENKVKDVRKTELDLVKKTTIKKSLLSRETKMTKMTNTSVDNSTKHKFKFIFVVTAYNCQAWIGKCIKTILDQNMKNWLLLLCDDSSSDRTYQIMKRYKNYPNVYLFKSNRNMGACYMRYYGLLSIQELIENYDVILLLGGDDWLAHDNVLNIINDKYQSGGDVTYGNWRSTSGKMNNLYYFPEEITKNRDFRKYKWISTAINTFRYYLFKRLSAHDFLDSNNRWIRNCTDLAIMFPIMELASNIIGISDVLYIYNNNHSHNTLKRFGVKNKGYYNKIIRNKEKKDKMTKQEIV